MSVTLTQLQSISLVSPESPPKKTHCWFVALHSALLRPVFYYVSARGSPLPSVKRVDSSFWWFRLSQSAVSSDCWFRSRNSYQTVYHLVSPIVQLGDIHIARDCAKLSTVSGDCENEEGINMYDGDIRAHHRRSHLESRSRFIQRVW